MSLYLTIYKNKVKICEFCRSSLFVQLFNPDYTEDLKEFDGLKSFSHCIEKVNENIALLKTRIDVYKNAASLNPKMSLEDTLDLATKIQNVNEEIEEYREYKSYFYFLMDMCDRYSSEKPLWEWRYC